MSTYTSEPGTRLAGRYRLVDQVSAGAGWTYWKATDETLARSVTVLTFATGFPRITETVTAARAASRLGDPRFSQVFDVEDADELAYVVLEWVAGESLLDMLSEGPLDPPRAAALVAEAARAIAAAHDTGLAHLRLDPACLHWTAARRREDHRARHRRRAGRARRPDRGRTTAPMTRELTDTRDLARLLYAALTGYWPGDRGPPVLRARAAPARAGKRRGPVHAAPGVRGRAGRHRRRDLPGAVPAAEPSRPGAQHRGDVRRRPGQRRPAGAAAVLPASTPPGPTATRGYDYQQDGSAQPVPAAGHGAAGTRPPAAARKPPRRALHGRPRRRQRRDRARPGGGRRGRLVGQPQPAPLGRPAAEPVRVLVVAGRGRSRPAQAGRREQLQPARQPTAVTRTRPARGNAIDGNASTFWHTSYYVGYPVFGGLKKGTGLHPGHGQSRCG